MAEQYEAPTAAEIAQAGNEGAGSALKGREFRDDCPYTYNRFPGMSVAEFNATKRVLMDAWFDEWQKNRRKD